MTVIQLPSARTRKAEANLAQFVERARGLAAFGPVSFDEPIWEAAFEKRRRVTSSAAQANRLYFTEVRRAVRGMDGRVPLKEPFAAFLKAVVRTGEDAASKHMDDHAAMIRAGRYLHGTMGRIEYNPCLLLKDHFDEAARVSRASDGESTYYTTGRKLQQIADYLNRYGMARVRIDFSNPAPYPMGSHPRIGAEADARRDSKLPSEAALDALAKLSHLVQDESDVLMMRIVELLVCGGWRINELLNIPADCEVEEEAVANGEVVRGPDGAGVRRYGIRYHGEKGAPPLPKWLPSPMVDVGKRALADIRRITQPTRDMVAWIAEHPGRVNIPGLDDGDPDTEIVPRELEEALGIAANSGQQWCSNRGVPYRVVNRQTRIRKGAIVDALLKDLPVLPPDSPYNLHEYMFLIPKNMTHRDRRNALGSVGFVTDGRVAVFLSGTPSCRSVFERFGMTDPDGNPIRMNTHQFRHWLNTLAQEGGMTQHELARWSGRKSIKQNAAYDHVSGAQLAREVRAVIDAGKGMGPVADALALREPQDRERFLEANVGTAHVTDIGICIHDWSMLPCLRHGSCADCDEHVVVKGDGKQRQAAARLLAETQTLLSAARDEVVEGTYGAPRWVDSQRRVATHLEAVLSIHDDASIPDGTFVHTTASHVPRDA